MAELKYAASGFAIDAGRRWTWEQITGEADDPLEREYPIGASDALQ